MADDSSLAGTDPTRDRSNAAEKPEILRGALQRIRYQTDDGDWAVAEIDTDDGRRITIVGPLLDTKIGQNVEVVGQWQTHPKFGKQLSIASIHAVVPTTPEAIERYLSSGLIEGIGPVLAQRIVETLGERTLEILDDNPFEIVRVPGIGGKRAESIIKAWQDQRAIRSVMIFLQSHGISPTFASRIWKQYGAKAIEIVRSNPYRLADDIFGIGFKKADDIAREAGFAPAAPERLRAGLLFTLREAHSDGHMYLPAPELFQRASQLLSQSPSLMPPELELLEQEARVIVEYPQAEGMDRTPLVYRTAAYEAEVAAADDLRRLMGGTRKFQLRSVDHQLAIVEERLGFHLAGAQRDAVRSAWFHKVSVITGGPGTGKTTIVRAVVALGKELNQRIGLCAPTGRAAKRLSEATGREASTVHRLLEFSPRENQFMRNHETPLDLDMLIVDEASMVDTYLLAAIVAAMPNHSALLLVGDVDQLPSVGPGNVLGDIIASHKIEVVRLTEIFRQAEQSNIVLNAHRINHGDMPFVPDRGEELSDFYIIGTEDPVVAQDRVVQLVTDRIPNAFGMNPMTEVQVLCPMHRGDVGTLSLNKILQEKFTAGNRELVRGNTTWRVGDKVMQTRNNYDRDIFNGDLGRIIEINTRTQHVGVKFDHRTVDLQYGELDELTHAYAITVHKSQGSEYRGVVIPIVGQHYIMLQRNLLYTAVTRATELVILVGSHKAIALAVQNNQAQRRYSRLDVRL